jgi:hypothetical protein
MVRGAGAPLSVQSRLLCEKPQSEYGWFFVGFSPVFARNSRTAMKSAEGELPEGAVANPYAFTLQRLCSESSVSIAVPITGIVLSIRTGSLQASSLR